MLGPMGENEAETGDGTADETLVQEEGGDGGRKSAVTTDSRSTRAAIVDVVLAHPAPASRRRRLAGAAAHGTIWGRRRTASIARGGPVRVGFQRAAGVIRAVNDRFRRPGVARGVVVRLSAGHGFVVAPVVTALQCRGYPKARENNAIESTSKQEFVIGIIPK